MVDYVIDIAYILVAIIILAIFTNRGFVGSVFKLGKTIIACILAFVFGPALGDFFYSKWFYDAIYTGVASRINAVVDGAVSSVDVKTVLDSLPQIVVRFINESSLEAKINESVVGASNVADDIAVSISGTVAEMVSNFLGYAAIFVATGLFLALFGRIISSLVKKIPIIKQIDRILGFLLGIAFAYTIMSLSTFVLGIAVSLYGGNETFEGLIEASKLFEFFGKYNIIEILRF